MSQKLWVQYKTTGKTYIDKISFEGCDYIVDFLNKLYERPELAPPENIPIALYKPGGTSEIDVGESPTDYLNENSRNNPLVVQKASLLIEVLSIALFSPCQILFYSNICNATVNEGLLSFEQTIPSSELNRLYVRESFKTIASSIKPGMNKSIITGTPGTGKSWFMIYLLWKLVKEGKRVLFLFHPDTIYYDGQGGVHALKTLPSVVDHSFWASDLWCLFDSKGKKKKHLGACPYGDCTFVISMAPRWGLVTDFEKPPPPEIFYMPPWTETEMGRIAAAFPGVAEWPERFRILGGIPRYVFEITNLSPYALLEATCKKCQLNDCLDSTITEESNVVHYLVHITSKDPFTESFVTFASQSVLDIIATIKGFEAKRRIIELLESCESNPLAASLCGYIFERYAIALLEKGGDFTCRQLVHGNKKAKHEEMTLTIPSSTRLVVNNVEVGQIENQLYISKTPNSAFDAWMPGIGAFQMTVGKSHDIKDGANKDLALLGTNANKLFWLLPPLFYHSFTRKSPHEIDQYALKIPYPSVHCRRIKEYD